MRRELPSDLRAWNLKFAGRCRSCDETLPMGEDAHWSPSKRQVWCSGCVTYLHAYHEYLDGLTGEEPIEGESEESEELSLQRKWRRLCTYARQSILAEAGESLARFDHRRKWFLQEGGQAGLIIGTEDEIDAPPLLQEILNTQDDIQSFIYGWPSVLAPGIQGKMHIAPLFVVPVDPIEPLSEGGLWKLRARQNPEFNLALLAGELFPLEISNEIDAELTGENSVPFGQPTLLVELAGRLSSVFDLNLNPLNPLDLARDLPPTQGIHNVAITVTTSGYGATHSVQQEIIRLASSNDWQSTGAAHLLYMFDQTNIDSPNKELSASPLESDASQEKVLNAVRKDPLTVVTGPPGTGKSQLVVNMASNAWLDNETCLIASTNNAAVDVATERASAGVAQSLIIRTGNRSKRDEISELISHSCVEAKDFQYEEPRARAKLELAVNERQKLLDALDSLGPYETALLKNSEILEMSTVDLWGNSPPSQLPIDTKIIMKRSERLMKSNFFIKWRSRWLFHRLKCSGENKTIETLSTWANATIERPLLLGKLEKLEDIIGDPAASITLADEKWRTASMEAVRSRIKNLLNNNSQVLADFTTSSPGFERLVNVIDKSFNALKGWSCTAMSAKANFKLKAGLFDLVVIDEASQCSLAVILPLAYRSKRLVILGDVNQLPPIISLSDYHLEQIATQSGVDNQQLIDEGKHHQKGSAFTAYEDAIIKTRNEPQKKVGDLFLLGEHYRCHPSIARWFNDVFYKSSLNVITDVSKMTAPSRGMQWIDLKESRAERPENSNRSWINEFEANLIRDLLLDIIRNGQQTVGVVTPFAAQARLIQRLITEEIGRETLSEVGFVSGSAFRLQGNEKDVIIFSPVVAPGISEHGRKWIEDNREMINVAASRARQSLLIVGHPEMHKYGGATLSSLRDYAIEISENSDSARYQTDSEPEKRLLSAMREAGLTPVVKILLEGYELDFAIQGTSGWLNVEVDGDQHIDERGQQVRADVVRDRNLQAIGWKVLRIKAWRCWKDLESVLKEIKQAAGLDNSSGI